MKTLVLTSNAIRHKFFANAIADSSDDTLVISECKSNDSAGIETQKQPHSLIGEHFSLRYHTEKEYFAGNDYFNTKTLPLLHSEVNLNYTYEVIKSFKPDVAFVFGSSILKEHILSLLSHGRFINLHLGLSPYYRGSGTNFWPFVNNELEYVGSTILHIDKGVDTGDIIAHVRPRFEEGDNVHKVGCKVIEESIKCIKEIIVKIKNGEKLNSVKQWEVPSSKYYRNRDFNEEILKKYLKNLEDKMIEKYISGSKKEIDLIHL